MRQEHHHYHADLQALDDRCLNPSQAADLNSIIHRSRRQVLKGGLALAAIGLFGTSLLGCQRSSAPVARPLLGFSGVAARSEERRVGKECRSRWWREHCNKKRADMTVT